MNDRRRVRTALVTLAAHNLEKNSVLNERGYVSGNLVVSGLLVGVGRAAGFRWGHTPAKPAASTSGSRRGTATFDHCAHVTVS